MVIKMKWKLSIENKTRFDSITGARREESDYWIRENNESSLSIALISNYRKDINTIGNLISAAPDMLSALELILNDNKLMNEMNRYQSQAIMDAVHKAKGN